MLRADGMRTYSLIVLPIAVPFCLAAQRAGSAHTLRAVSALRNSASFSVPAGWHVLTENDSGTVGQYIYHIRNPSLDSIWEERANVC